MGTMLIEQRFHAVLHTRRQGLSPCATLLTRQSTPAILERQPCHSRTPAPHAVYRGACAGCSLRIGLHLRRTQCRQPLGMCHRIKPGTGHRRISAERLPCVTGSAPRHTPRAQGRQARDAPVFCDCGGGGGGGS